MIGRLRTAQVRLGTAASLRSVLSWQGTAKTDQVGSALGEILAAVEQTVQRVTGIAMAAQEMSAAARGH
jgi:methyl-accepting chemotaxis protein